MATAAGTKALTAALKNELMLHVNQRLYDAGIIPRDVYELAKIKLVNRTYP